MQGWGPVGEGARPRTIARLHEHAVQSCSRHQRASCKCPAMRPNQGMVNLSTLMPTLQPPNSLIHRVKHVFGKGAERVVEARDGGIARSEAGIGVLDYLERSAPQQGGICWV